MTDYPRRWERGLSVCEKVRYFIVTVTVILTVASVVTVSVAVTGYCCDWLWL